MRFKIGVFGKCKVDNIVTADGEVAVQIPGGNGMHAAAGVRLWNEGCLLVGEAPENLPEQWRLDLEQAGVDTRNVVALPGFRPEATEWCFYRPDGSRRDNIWAPPREIAALGIPIPVGLEARTHLAMETRAALEQLVVEIAAGRPTLQPDPSTRLSANDPAARLLATEAVHLAPNSLDVHRAMAERLSRAGRVVSLDPGHYVQGLSPSTLAELLEWVTIFIPSEREVHEFLGPCNLAEAAKDFSKLGPWIVAIKLGARGSMLYDRRQERLEHIPALALDPTGGGDSYCGGFLAGFMETGDALEAARYGTIAASFTVERFGATATLNMTRQDAERRLSILRA